MNRLKTRRPKNYGLRMGMRLLVDVVKAENEQTNDVDDEESTTFEEKEQGRTGQLLRRDLPL